MHASRRWLTYNKRTEKDKKDSGNLTYANTNGETNRFQIEKFIERINPIISILQLDDQKDKTLTKK